MKLWNVSITQMMAISSRWDLILEIALPLVEGMPGFFELLKILGSYLEQN